jgi:hypothetical protein
MKTQTLTLREPLFDGTTCTPAVSDRVGIDAAVDAVQPALITLLCDT